MWDKIRNFWNSPWRKQLTDKRSIGLYVFGVFIMAMTWSGVKTLQTNYELQKQISTLKQQNNVLYLKNQNSALENQYLESNEFLDLAARQDLGLAAPGERVLLIPKAVAMKYVDSNLSSVSGTAPGVINVNDNRSKVSKNLEDWRDFLLGRKLFSD